MKKSIFYVSILLALLTVSCSGNDGFDGRDGVDGVDGSDGIQAQVLEIDGVNYDYDFDANLYTARITFSDFTDFEVLEEDAILIYRFDGVVDLTDGPANNWSLIPQNFFTADGTIQYTYAHNFVDTDLFIDGNYDLENLGADFTQNQFFRIVFVPSTFLTSKSDKSNIESVMAQLGLEEEDVQKVQVN